MSFRTFITGLFRWALQSPDRGCRCRTGASPAGREHATRARTNRVGCFPVLQRTRVTPCSDSSAVGRPRWFGLRSRSGVRECQGSTETTAVKHQPRSYSAQRLCAFGFPTSCGRLRFGHEKQNGARKCLAALFGVSEILHWRCFRCGQPVRGTGGSRAPLGTMRQ